VRIELTDRTSTTNHEPSSRTPPDIRPIPAVMQQQDAFLSHVISQTLASLSFLQSQNVLYASPELDQVRSQLSSRQNGSSDAGAITYNAVPSQAQTYPSSSASSAIVPSLPPRRVDSSNSQNVPNRAVAMWNYDSSAQGDLAFRKDDVIIIDEEGEKAIHSSQLSGRDVLS
jgi:hypothetical protein